MAKIQASRSPTSILSVHIEAFMRGIEIVAGMLAKKEVKVVFRGTDCKTDGRTIYLPEVRLLARKNMSMAEVKEAEDFLAALRGYLDHEVAHVLYTDFTSLKKRVGKNAKVWETTNALEDPRIEVLMAKAWAGAGFNLQASSDYVYAHFKDETIERLSPVQQILLGINIVARDGYDKPPALYGKLPTKARRIVESKKVRAIVKASLEAPGVLEVVDCAEELLAYLKEEAKAQQEEEKQEKEKAEKKKGKQKIKLPGKPPPSSGESSDEEGDVEVEYEEEPDEEPKAGKSKPKKSKKEDEESEEDEESGSGESTDEEGDEESDEEGSGGGKGEEEDDSEEESDASGAGDEKDEEGEEEDASNQKQGGGSYGDALESDLNASDDAFEQKLEEISDAAIFKQQLPDPANYVRGMYSVYTTEDDKCEPYAFKTQHDVEAAKVQYKALMDEVGASTLGVIQRSLRNYLKSKAYSIRSRDLERGKIDRRRLYRLPAGIGTRVFYQDREHLDLANVAVSLWVNESGSMSDAYDQTYSPKIILAKHVVVAFAEVLDYLGIPFEVCGHTTGNPEAISHFHGSNSGLPMEAFARWGTLDVRVYKTFEEQWKTVRHRVTTMSARNNTYDGEALLLATRRILTRKETRRVIFLLDDGQPYPNSGEKQADHCAYLKDEVVPKVLGSGVEVVGVGMGTDSVKHYYPRAVVVTQLAKLGQIVLTELRDVLDTTRLNRKVS